MHIFLPRIHVFHTSYSLDTERRAVSLMLKVFTGKEAAREREREQRENRSKREREREG